MTMRRVPRPKDSTIIQETAGRFRLARDGASVVIGAPDDGDFRPRVHASKWGNEAWLTVEPDGIVSDKQAAKLVTKNGKRAVECTGTHRVNGKQRTHLFRVVDGSTELELEWGSVDDVPDVGYVDFLLGFPSGLEFHKQLALTEAEIDAGYSRPENVVNSYAVYWPQSGRFLDVDGSELVNYETGKFAHVYRSQLIDADGNSTWVDQTVILDAPARLRVYLSDHSDWLRNARYPVVLDPTFGYSTVGGSNSNNGAGNYYHDCTVRGSYSASAGDTVTAVAYYGKTVGAVNVSAGVYALSSGAPGALLGSGNIASNNTVQWWELSGQSWAMSAGTSYSPAFCHTNDGVAVHYIYYDSLTGTNRYYKLASSPLSDPYGTGTGDGAAISCYATYTAAASGHPAMKRFGGVPFAALNRGVW